MTPGLVIFDCDGVLVDSEVLVVEIEAEMLTAAGFSLTADDIIERYVGMSYTDMMTDIGEVFGRPVPGDLGTRVEQAALDALPEHLMAVTGIDSVLAALATDRCVASSSDPARIGISLEVTGLDRHFDPAHIFSATMVERGKPAPDLFLHAAAAMGRDVDDCVVVEDSPYGVAAGVAAGMDVIGFVGGGHANASLGRRLGEAGAPTVLDDARALAGLLSAG